MVKNRKSPSKSELERWIITTIKKTCDYENQKKIIMKILPLPCPYREN